MAYRIERVTAPMAVGTDFESAARELERRVGAAMLEGWRPQGGLVAAHPLGGGQPTLLQALVCDGELPPARLAR